LILTRVICSVNISDISIHCGTSQFIASSKNSMQTERDRGTLSSNYILSYNKKLLTSNEENRLYNFLRVDQNHKEISLCLSDTNMPTKNIFS